MAGEEIEFTITKDGIKFDASGFTGDACLSALERFVAFMKANGIDVQIKDQKMKYEMYADGATSKAQEYRR